MIKSKNTVINKIALLKLHKEDWKKWKLVNLININYDKKEN